MPHDRRFYCLVLRGEPLARFPATRTTKHLIAHAILVMMGMARPLNPADLQVLPRSLWRARHAAAPYCEPPPSP